MEGYRKKKDTKLRPHTSSCTPGCPRTFHSATPSYLHALACFGANDDKDPRAHKQICTTAVAAGCMHCTLQVVKNSFSADAAKEAKVG